jgi:hypothetical protein
MSKYEQSKWFDLYRTALLELERAAMTGRIGDARAEIALRLEALKEHPDLHKDEYQAIQDALNNLRVLEREEAILAASVAGGGAEAAIHRSQVSEPRLSREFCLIPFQRGFRTSPLNRCSAVWLAHWGD